MSLGDRLFDLRQNAKASLQRVADAVGVSKAHIWELEKGRSTNPSHDLVRKLAAFYNVTPEALTGLDAAPPPEDLQIGRIHRGLEDLTPRDRDLIEEMVRTMRERPPPAKE